MNKQTIYNLLRGVFSIDCADAIVRAIALSHGEPDPGPSNGKSEPEPSNEVVKLREENANLQLQVRNLIDQRNNLADAIQTVRKAVT